MERLISVPAIEESLEELEQGELAHTSVTDLCQVMHFRAVPFVRNDVTYTGWMSRTRTLATNERASSLGYGDCKYICAPTVYNRGRGTMQVAILTSGLQSVGGFAAGFGHTRALLHTVLRGTVTIWSSGTECRFG